ncbi:MAG: 1-deoxy-D-xylulose-5-phosphate reductoisomerase [Prevotella sp.]|nr:1-deoxy-D-xylulose-5-phosphate reductoisomerase [Prevotella sp.]
MDRNTKKQQICILGSTGSIGTQALEVIAEHADLYEVYCLTAFNQVELLAQQARQFMPAAVVIANEAHYERLCSLLDDCPDIKVYAGAKALDEIVQAEPIDMVLTAMVGFAGLTPTVNAIKARKKICLANKETLVVAGEIIMRLAQENRCPILPVDSEHSAIFQSLVGDECNEIEKILLTASGGPFRTFSLEQMKSVTAADALRHPTWDMGAKITIDSASMMNKGFEVIEARWLFGVPAEKIQVLVHPQSIVHSAIQYIDGSVKAQLGVPDMRLPIQYAFSYPQRLHLSGERLDLFKHTLEFYEPDMEKFRCLAMAYESLRLGGNMPCIVNAANEVVNEAFRKDRCGFLQMGDIIADTMQKTTFIQQPTLEDLLNTDAEARRIASECLSL